MSRPLAALLRGLRSLFALALSAAGLAAQVDPPAHLWATWSGPSPGDQYGRALASLGDVDGDGWPDFACGAPYAAPGGSIGGLAELRAGAAGLLLHALHGEAGSQLGAALAGPGDLNGDGQADWAVGAPLGGPGAQGELRVLSGAEGVPLYSVHGVASGSRFGGALAALGDLDGDGCSELAVAARMQGDAGPLSGAVHVLSGADGSTRFVSHGDSGGEMHGWSVGAAGDLDLDGVPDLLVGAPTAWTGSRVRALSGVDGALLHAWVEPSGALYGHSVRGGVDLDADGLCEVAIGAPFDGSGAPYGGRVSVHSGTGASELWRVHGAQLEGFLGESLAWSADSDGNGVRELFAGAPGGPQQRGRVQLLSGVDGAALQEWHGVQEGDGFGVSVVELGDVNADGRPEFLVGASAKALEGVQAGATRLLSPEPLLLRASALGLALGSPASVQLELSGGAGAAGAPYLVLGSLSGSAPPGAWGGAWGALGLPLVPDAYTQLLLAAPSSAPLQPVFGSLDAQGAASALFQLPDAPPPSWAGLVLHHAAWVGASSAAQSSLAVPLYLLP